MTENPLRDPADARREAGPATIVIFGATGDLARRKLLPALYDLAADGLLHPDTVILGFARRPWSDDEFRATMEEGVREFARHEVDAPVWEDLARGMGYVASTFDDGAGYDALAKRLAAIEGARGEPGGRLFYLATPPEAYAGIAAGLGTAGLVRRAGEAGWSRIIVEKPFGHDRATAAALNRDLHEVFREDQVFRIDHYLGKETVQNILVFRLGNGIFEPIWNSRHVDHVQITVAESIGIGTRAGYYEEAGVVRDMLQNHLLQLLMLTAMEPPVRFDAEAVRDEKVKVLRAMPLLARGDVARNVVRGQYAAGTVAARPVPGYREEKGVAPDSRTDTYLAAKFEIESWRWSGTPFYLRSGKRLPRRATEIAVTFKQPPVSLFRAPGVTMPAPNVLRLRVQPEEGISLAVSSKAPGQTLHIDEVRMDMNYATAFAEGVPEAYERLILDAVLGDSTLFTREDEVDAAWTLVDGIVGAWRDGADGGPFAYEAGTWGPDEADRLLERDGRAWERL